MLVDHPLDPKNMWKIGSSERYPIRICANPNCGSYGDFAMQLFFINTVAEQFDFRKLSIIYRDNYDFKKALLRLLPVDNLIFVGANQALPPMDLIDGNRPLYDPNEPALKAWFDNRWNLCDLFISDHMAGNNTLWSFPELAYLRFPESDVSVLTAELVARGVNPDKWFCTLHCREPGYLDKRSGVNLRDQDPNAFYRVTLHLIERLGGQVVRIGHPAMTEYPKHEGLIDLSRQTGNSYLQTFAMSRSRFLYAGPSGPSGVANALHLPHMQINAVDFPPENDRMVWRTMDAHFPNGSILNQEAFADAGFCKLGIIDLVRRGVDIRFKRITEAEMIRAANYIYEVTVDTPGWREPDPRPNTPRPNQLIWPGPPKPRGWFLSQAT